MSFPIWPSSSRLHLKTKVAELLLATRVWSNTPYSNPPLAEGGREEVGEEFPTFFFFLFSFESFQLKNHRFPISIIVSTSLLNDIFAVFAAIGKRLVLVIPGKVLISRK